MKLHTAITATLLLLATGTLHAQGPLAPPPGVPAPNMKSLDQIEARTNLNSIPGNDSAVHVINQPGNYYLTANIVGNSGKSGILINAKNVNIDLNGFAIIGSGPGSGNGISELDPDTMDGSGMSVSNGRILNWGGTGILMQASYLGTVQHLIINQCAGGILAYGAQMVSHCYLNSVGNYGIYLTSNISHVSDCKVNGVSSGSGAKIGIYNYGGTVVNSAVHGVIGSPGKGIVVEFLGGAVRGCTVNQVHSNSVAGVGIEATSISDCLVSYTSSSNASTTAIKGRHIERCTVSNVAINAGSGTATGIFVTTPAGMVEQCHVANITGHSGYGIFGEANQVRIKSSAVNTVTGTGGFAYGIYATSVAGCQVSSVSNTGATTRGIAIQSTNGGSIHDCDVNAVQGQGIYLINRGIVSNCQVSSSGTGIFVGGISSRIEGNHVANCTTGFVVNVSNSNNVLLRNSAASNTTTNYSIASGSVAPLVSAANAATSTNPLANLNL